MSRKELNAAIKKAYEQGYRKGNADVCDVIALALIHAITDVVEEMKEAAQKTEAEVFDELEEEE